MYAREIQGRVHTLGVSGKLIMNALVMFDRETDTLWSQFLGEAVDGPLKGTKLDFVGSQIVSWDAWLRAHPDTAVLNKRGRYRSDPYGSYYTSGATGIIPETYKDSRLPTKALVMGLNVNGVSKAYPIDELQLQGTSLVHDTLGDRPVVIVFDPVSETAVAFEASSGDDLANLTLLGPQDDGNPLLVDEETGRQWNAFSGEPVDGPADMKPLRRIPAFVSFWFAWKDYHPETLLFLG